MLFFFVWYLLITLVGMLAFPLTYQLLPHLADRGYALARAVGLLVWGYLFWLLASFGLLQNNPGGILLALLVVVLLSAWAVRARRTELRDWLRENRRTVFTVEGLFLVAFAALAVVRAANQEIGGTEKPMELAFINAILRSPTFPPHDPWLSGYAISYYYFGYVLVALLAMLTGTPGAVAFNLGLALVFALAALGAYTVVYTLLSLRLARRAQARGWALLAPALLLVVSNIEGFFEMLHARGVFWSQAADGSLVSRFWSWLGILELSSPPTEPFSWVPERVGGIWWWRASRVLQDYNLAGEWKEIIDEPPAFSFVLGDLHPHVLAMPFALLAVALALNFYLSLRRSPLPEMGVVEWLRLWVRNEQPRWRATRLGVWVRTPGFWLAAVILGGLSFLNTWDFPIYVALMAATYVLHRFERQGWGWARIGELIELSAALGLLGALLYLPFYVGFQSQAGGILPSLSFFTRGAHLWVMFATLLTPVFAWLGWRWARGGSRPALWNGLRFAAGVLFGLWALSFVMAGLFGLLADSPVGAGSALSSAAALLYGLHGATGIGALLGGSFARRLAQPGGWLTLFALLTLIWGLLSRYRRCAPVVSARPDGVTQTQPRERSANAFVLLLALLGAGLVLFPEFFYLRDQFGWRMNTVFKFYYQAWIVWSLAAAYAVAVLATQSGKVTKWVARAGFSLLIAMGLVYTLFGMYDRASGFQPGVWTLDGAYHLQQYSPDEWQAIEWLRQAPLGAVAEAVGGSYSPAGHARVSTFSGQPAVLGWPGHESQWRGGSVEMSSREADIATIFRTTNWEEAAALLARWNVRYVYLGSLERSTYRADESKFAGRLTPVFQNASVTIYAVPDAVLNAYTQGENPQP